MTPSGDGNETFTPSTAQTVNIRVTQAFTLTAAAGYTVSATVGGSCPAGSWSGSTYTTGAITANCTVSFSATLTSISLTVEAAYPTNGANWNDYVENDGSDIYSASDTACNTATATSYTSCLEGGEMRKVVVTGVSSCSGLTMTDALGVFDWTCTAESGTATFYSSLDSAHGLRDLINSTPAWIADSVTLSGTAIGSSTSAVWWSNAVTALPNGSSVNTLSTAGTIYVASSNLTTYGYNIAANQIAIVTLSGVTLTWNSSAGENFNWPTGKTTSPNDYGVIASGSENFNWIEANIDAGNSVDSFYLESQDFDQVYRTSVINGGQEEATAVISLDGLEYSRIRQVSIPYSATSGGTNAGMYAGQNNNDNGNDFEQVSISDVSGVTVAGFVINGQDNFIDELTVADTQGDLGIEINKNGMTTGTNTLLNVKAYDNDGDGITINQPTYLIGAVSVGNAGAGIDCTEDYQGCVGSEISDSTVAFNSGPGLYVDDALNSVNNLVSIGNGNYGVEITNGGIGFSNLALSDSATYDLYWPSSGDNDGNTFDGNLIVGSSTTCKNSSGKTGFTTANCALNGSSTGTVSFAVSVEGDFVQAIGTQDTANASDNSLGQATYAASSVAGFDWLDFSNIYRLWGVWKTPGQWLSGTGSILDFSLLVTGTKIYNDTLAYGSSNGSFVAGSTCPSAVNGDEVTTNPSDEVYLLNAAEIVDPNSPGYTSYSANHHSGLCETGDSCLYTPNFGAYQGQGTLSTCNFQNGTVTGVTMWGYATNGI